MGSYKLQKEIYVIGQFTKLIAGIYWLHLLLSSKATLGFLKLNACSVQTHVSTN